jgi:CBS-domain-containing membrane protein
VFNSLLHGNCSTSAVACLIISAGTCLPSRCLAMNVISGSAISAFRLHVTVWGVLKHTLLLEITCSVTHSNFVNTSPMSWREYHAHSHVITWDRPCSLVEPRTGFTSNTLVLRKVYTLLHDESDWAGDVRKTCKNYFFFLCLQERGRTNSSVNIATSIRAGRSEIWG